MPRTSQFDGFSHSTSESKGPLLWCVDAGLFAAIFILPFVMGGRQAIGELTLVGIASWTAFAWLLHSASGRASRWRISGLEPVLLAGIALCTLQTLSLTPELIDSLSPHVSRLLPLWQSSADTEGALSLVDGRWTSVSLVPAATRSSLCCVIAVAMLFVVALQRIDTIADAQLLMRAVAVSAILMALFGCGQFLFGNGRFYWFYDHPFTHTRDYAKGAFTNPNHFADYLAMSLPILLAWYATYSQRPRENDYNAYPSLRERLARLSGPISLVGLVVVSIGVLLSQSRGGLVTACVGAIVTLVILLRQRVLSFTAAGTIGGMALAALLSLTFFGSHIQSLVEHNFHELVSGDMQQLDRKDARQKIWAAALDGMSDYPLLGTGLSTHREVYWTYFNHPDIDGEFSHAESGYLQVGLETGYLGLGLAAAALLMIAFWCFRGLKRTRSPEAGALLAAIVGVFAVDLLHSVTDFVWYVPSCMTVIALLAACASRLDRLSAPVPARPRGVISPVRSRGFAFVGATCVLLLAAWMVQVKRPALAAEPLWFDYIHMVRDAHQLDDAFDREEYERQKLATVLAAAEADPSNCRIQLRAAAAALTLYNDARKADSGGMSLGNIRDAARTSPWESPEQLQEWLNNPGVLGDRTRLDEAWNRTQRALSLCPLLAEGYVKLGELAWLYGATRKEEDALLVQSLLVRPYDPLVHFAAGREAWLRGKETAALEHWKLSFQRGPRYQKLIVELLSPLVPATFFLDNFDPDTAALARLRDAYRGSHDPEGFQSVCTLLGKRFSAEAAEARHLQAVLLWQKAHDAFAEIGDAANARRAAESAVAADPNSYAAHLLLGRSFYQSQEYAAAREHLEFCHHRRPQDGTLKQMLETALRLSAGPSSRVAAEPAGGFPSRRL